MLPLLEPVMLRLLRCLSLASIVSAILFSLPSQAQITGDGTLGTRVNGSLTAPCTGTCFIRVGSPRGSNLFHSFRQFSLQNPNDVAAFVITPRIRNVIVRVTGVGQSFISNINGVIATVDPAVTVITPANLFLINPNGIVFGPNAQISIGGAFLATTADRMVFQDGTLFDTRDRTPLLTISVPIGLQMGATPANIQMQSASLVAGWNSQFTNFALVGGNISLDGTEIVTPDYRVELGGLATAGVVGLDLTQDDMRLQFPEGIDRADVALNNGSQIYVAGDIAGDIAITARNISFTGNSRLFAGIDQGLGAADSQAGDVTLNATETIQLVNSYVFNGVQPNAIGNGGSLNITARTLALTDGAQLNTNTLGQGNTGDIIVHAKIMSLDSGSGVFSSVEPDAIGKGGNIDIVTDLLSLTSNSEITTRTTGQGDAGRIRIDARIVSLNGASNGKINGVLSLVQPGGVGKGGDVDIITTSLFLADGSRVTTGAFGQGDAGNVTIAAESVLLSKGYLGSATANQGNAGDVTIQASTVLLDQASGVTSRVGLGAGGKGGGVNITADRLSLTNGAQIASDTFGNGDAGGVTIQAKTISLDGRTSSDRRSGVYTSAEPGSTGGRGGDIKITTDTLSLTNQAQLLAGTFGQGDGGNIAVHANTISMSNGRMGSQVELNAIGRAGDISITTEALLLMNGAYISSSTFGQGDAGDITVHANTIFASGDGSGIISGVNPGAVAQGGDVNITTQALALNKGAKITANVFGQGNAGNVSIQARTIAFDGTGSNGTPSSLGSAVEPGGIGNGGSISITTDSLSLTDSAGVVAYTAGLGNAGNITIQSKSTSLDASIVSSAVATGGVGQGGNLSLTTNLLSLSNGAQLVSSTFNQGNAGNITVRANTVSLTGRNQRGQSAIFSTVQAGAVGDGGIINLTTDSLSLSRDAIIAASIFGQGNAGNIQIQASRTSVDGGNILSSVERGGVGRGGNISLNTDTLSLSNGANLGTNAKQGLAGNIAVKTGDLRLNRGAITSTTASGDGGNINLAIGKMLLMRHGSRISTSAGLAQGGGNGGNITINARNGFLVTLPNENNDITANAFNGSGGRVTIDAQGIYWFTLRNRTELAKLLGTNDPNQLDPNRLQTNDITAVSQGNPTLNGTITLNTPDVDPSRGLQSLPITFLDPTNQLSPRCAPGSSAQRSSFVIVGRGGLPESPLEPLRSREGIVEWVEAKPVGSVEQRAQNYSVNQTVAPSLIADLPSSIVEANGWVVDQDGHVILVAIQPLPENQNFQWLPVCASPPK